MRTVRLSADINAGCRAQSYCGEEGLRVKLLDRIRGAARRRRRRELEISVYGYEQLSQVVNVVVEEIIRALQHVHRYAVLKRYANQRIALWIVKKERRLFCF